MFAGRKFCRILLGYFSAGFIYAEHAQICKSPLFHREKFIFQFLYINKYIVLAKKCCIKNIHFKLKFLYHRTKLDVSRISILVNFQYLQKLIPQNMALLGHACIHEYIFCKSLLRKNFYCFLNPLRARAFFWALFFNYRKFDFVTQFLRNESTKIQSFVYHFVENFKLLHENVKFLS